MLSNKTIKENRDLIIRMLVETNRAGVMALLQWLEDSGYFESPAAAHHHGSYAGGLAQHSLNVFGKYVELASVCGVEVPADSVTIACLLHDMCKCGRYVKVDGGYEHDSDHPAGHALLSIERISQFIPLTARERKMIRFHMGIYGANDARTNYAEYPFSVFVEAVKDPAVKLMAFADELASLEETAALEESLKRGV